MERRKFTREFKLEAVKLLISTESWLLRTFAEGDQSCCAGQPGL